ncbi:class I SAM-dependent methyltransferase [Streptomyces yangpuensis]|uniref:class I SAM-dependent methyltransferase n=1 Tax=Streptomyces yangpuensis TaxID=1648182 RepID=UPI00365C3E01
MHGTGSPPPNALPSHPSQAVRVAFPHGHARLPRRPRRPLRARPPGLDRIRRPPGPGPRRPAHRRAGLRPHTVLDNACGIGTRALGLSAPGREVAGTDLSPRSAARAAREAAARGLAPPVAAADMRTRPFVDASFDAVVCADNALPHC